MAEKTEGGDQTQATGGETTTGSTTATTDGATTGTAATGQSSEATAAPAVEPTVTLGANAVVSDVAITTLKGILKAAGLTSATISSGVRDSFNQARIMYDNLESYGVEAQKALYGGSGDKVIDVYSTEKAAKKTATEIKAAMQAKITALGPATVSKHCSDTHDVFDVAPSSISDKPAFEKAVQDAKTAGTISHYIFPPTDPGYHIEKPK